MNITLHLAHLGLLDSAPLLVAQAQGFFEQAGLDVQLRCELGYAAVTTKLLEQQYHGACLPAELPVLLTLPHARVPVPMEVVAVVSFQNLAVVGKAATLDALLQPKQALKLGLPTHVAAARTIGDRWLTTLGGTVPNRTQTATLTSSQLLAFLQEGLIDAFVGPEPLPAIAARRTGFRLATTSAALAPFHPGAVVALRSDVTATAPEALPRLAQALRRASAYCAEPAHAHEVWRLVLGQSVFFGLSEDERTALQALPLSGLGAAPLLRFTHPTSDGGIDAAALTFLDAAVRAALGPGNRTAHSLRGEILRVYRLSPQPAAL